jgi:hypothetical protein
MVYIHIKRNEILPFAGKWMDLEDIMLSEIGPAQKGEYPVFSLTYTS